MISPEILRRYPYFAGVSEESLVAVAEAAEEQSFHAGHVLWNENDSADHMYIVVEGEVDIQYVFGSGERSTVDTIVGGELMVWSSVVAPHTTHSVGVATKPTKLVAIQAVKLRELMKNDTTLGYHLMDQVAQVIASRLRGARVQLATLAPGDPS